MTRPGRMAAGWSGGASVLYCTFPAVGSGERSAGIGAAAAGRIR